MSIISAHGLCMYGYILITILIFGVFIWGEGGREKLKSLNTVKTLK